MYLHTSKLYFGVAVKSHFLDEIMRLLPQSLAVLIVFIVWYVKLSSGMQSMGLKMASRLRASHLRLMRDISGIYDCKCATTW